MAKTRDIKRRIGSIQSTMKLTRAMKMVAAAKLRRSQDRIMAARPYAGYMRDVLRSLAGRVDAEASPLLEQRDGKSTEVIVVTSDRGMCGGFNASVFRDVTNHMFFNKKEEFTLACVGKKGHDYFKSRATIGNKWTSHMRDVQFPLADEIASYAMERYLSGEVDRVYLAYNQFKSAMTQETVIEQVLPIEKEDLPEGSVGEAYIYEPSAQALLETLLPRHVKIQFFRALLESIAAEHAARMTAMDAATNNAGELIDSLTLTMNRLRQASITTEIIEVVSGAEAAAS
jgi:F-type H+-transporting ATPase subunit gamma